MRRDEVDLGALSREEAALAEPESHRLLREAMQDQHYEAQKMREWFEAEIERRIQAKHLPDMAMIRTFADHRAREYHLTLKLEEMGWR